MTPRLPNQNLLPSLIDRLMDVDPQLGTAGVAAPQSMRAMKDSVRRDLEWLLNSRRTLLEPPPSARELARSVYCYGLADVNNFALATEQARFELAHRIQTAIATFEPRLRNVQVRLMPSAPGSRVLQFQIEALMRTEPAPSRVYFDTTFETIKGEYQIAGDRNAR